jgi:hypothetical protein
MRGVSAWRDDRSPGVQTAPETDEDDKETSMAKKARKKKARKHSKANHGKRPNS